MSMTEEEPALQGLLSRVAELERANARLQEELTHERAGRATAAEQTRTQTRSRPRRSSRRKMLTKGLEVAAASVGAGVLLELSSGTALASELRPEFTHGVFVSNVFGTPAVSATGSNGADGVDGSSDTSDGVHGESSAGDGVGGVSSSGAGVRGFSPGGMGVSGESNSGTGVFGSSLSGLAGHFSGNVSMDNNLAVTGTLSSGAGTFTSTVPATPAVSASGTSGAVGLSATSDSGDGIVGQSGGLESNGVFGQSNSGTGVFGQSNGNSTECIGVKGSGVDVGVVGESANGIGILGQNSIPEEYAGQFQGNVEVSGNLQVNGNATIDFHRDLTVTGTLSKGGGSFKIDHPLDPAHKYLSHSFVESPDMKNIYDGVVTLDAHGEAEVTLPAWFDALNTDFRYQLTALGSSAPELYIAEELHTNRFKVAGGQAGTRVSWQVTSIRQDTWANAYRIPVEQDKPPQEQGSYLYPELYGQVSR